MSSQEKYRVGQKYHGFVFTKCLPIEELQAVLYELTHEKSGALVMHIACEDPENLFCLSFKTLPEDSKGAAHILEHTVLCGSEKFPIKDPFFCMDRRSLRTFMNAMTGSDFTCYPAASQVKQDFYNLLDVYLDAVFHPELKEMSFLQEGCRLELKDPSNIATSPLEFKGIVFNEMKGSLSSPDSRIWHTVMEHLVPDLTYAHNSGGDPRFIPDLTYEELLAFHAKFYHPSRCLFFFYGNFSLEEHLDYIEKRTLANVDPKPNLSPIGRQKRFKQPKEIVSHYPILENDLTDKSLAAFSWLTAPLADHEEVLALTLLDVLLMDTDASPLKHALLASGLCRSADGLIDTEMSEIPYIIICKGTNPDQIDSLQTVIYETLEKIAKEGFEYNQVLSALHQLEFDRMEITGDYAPFGLTLFMRSALDKQHGNAPENALFIHSTFQKLLKHVENPQYLPSLIRQYFLDNPHFVVVKMLPDQRLAEKELELEQAYLARIAARLSLQDRKKILKKTAELKKFQEDSEHGDEDILPKITLKDIPKKSREFELDTSHLSNLHIQSHHCFTNHIVYADIILDLPTLSLDELMLTKIYMAMIPELGCGGHSYEQTLSRTQAYTGGIQVGLSLHPQYGHPGNLYPALHLHGKALARHSKELFQLFTDILSSSRTDEEARVRHLIMQTYTHLQQKLNKNALGYAIQLCFSGSGSQGTIQNHISGIQYFQFIRDLAVNLDTKLPEFMQNLAQIKEKLLHNYKPLIVVSSGKEEFKELEANNFHGISNLPVKHFTPWQGNFIPQPISSQGRIISSPVAASCFGMITIAEPHEDAPALSAASLIMDNTVLHAKIREQGGAYGSGASYSPTTGSFYVYSYRDPHIVATKQAFHEAIEALSSGDFDEKEITEAKIGLIQALDLPVAPGSRALAAYTALREGRTVEKRQVFRNKILKLEKKDIQTAVKKHLIPLFEKGTFIVFSGEELLERERHKEGLETNFPIYPI